MADRSATTVAAATPLLRRLHIWIGLLNLTSLLVMGAAGIVTALHTSEPARTVSTFAYTPRPDASDPDIANEIFDRLHPGVAQRPPSWSLHRTDAGQLTFDINGPNTQSRVVVDETAHSVRVETAAVDLGRMLTYLHRQSSYWAIPDIRTRLWGLYVDLSIVSLLYLSTSGIWLWLASRPRLRWARVAFVAGVAAFGLVLFGIF